MTTNYRTGIIGAVKYNAKMATRLGWYRKLPEQALAHYPGLREDPVKGGYAEKREFVSAVAGFQMTVLDFRPVDVDGRLGKRTWKAMIAKYAPTPEGDYYLHDGIPRAAESQDLHTWDQPGGLSLHTDGGFRKPTRREIRLIVIHWGGFDARHCRDVLAARDLSSHFGVDAYGTYQWLDTAFSAYHAGYVNDFSLGVDVCQQPMVKSFSRYDGDPESDVTVIKNPTNRGSRRCLSLDSRTAKRTRDLVLDACRAYDVPLMVPRTRSGKVDHATLSRWGVQKGAFQGVVGHHHLSKKKWDIAPWWAQIFDGTPLGD